MGVSDEDAAEERWPSKIPPDDKRIRHNHLTRDIKPRGVCPGCDAYCRSGQVDPSQFGRTVTEQ